MTQTMINLEAININVALHESSASVLLITDKAASPIFSSACRRHRLIGPNHWLPRFPVPSSEASDNGEHLLALVGMAARK